MLKLTKLSIRRGPQLLLDDVNLTIHRGAKVGVTGANGTGKSSFFALIRGDLHPDTGDLEMPSLITIAHVAQETPATDTPAIEYVMDGDTELRALQREIARTEARGDGYRHADLHAKLEAIDGYTARARAGRLLHGLGFRPDQDEIPVRQFSGGWRMRLNLAQALMCRSDLLLLDEPTNHLDLDAVIWLEDWLRRYRGTLLLISHDRDFLDRVADHIAHIEQSRMTLYTGNYSAFEQQRAARLALQQAAHAKQQREIEHIQQFVARFRAKATKARQAQSRLKALERMERIVPAHVDSPFNFVFRAPDKLPNPLINLESVSAGYGTTPVLQDVDLRLQPYQRVGLLGHNGAGKSTLIRLLAGTLPPLSGKRLAAGDLRVGYFAQHQLDQLDPGANALLHLHRLDPQATEQAQRDFLGGFGFHGERAEQPITPFSGGEKARLALALIVYQRPNLLLLDEPTNHLDLEMRHALNLALQEFKGAMVLVSHDRHLLRTVTDDLYLVHQGRVGRFDGDLDDYPRWLADHRSDGVDDANGAFKEHSTVARKSRKREEAEQRRRLQPLRKQANQLEKEIERLSTEKSRLDTQLCDPALYAQNDAPTIERLLLEQARVAQALEQTENRWLQVHEELDRLSA